MLFTFPQSTAHIGSYQSYGFLARGLTAIMSRPVTAPSPVPQAQSLTALGAERGDAIAQCAAVTGALFPGLDLRDELATVVALPGSDAIVLTEGSQVVGFAIVHCGSGSEADTGIAYAKFAAVRPGATAAHDFRRLLDAANDFAHRNGAAKLNAGVNMGCMEAYRLMIAAGFRTVMQGVAMHRPWIEVYDRADVFALEDWRQPSRFDPAARGGFQAGDIELHHLHHRLHNALALGAVRIVDQREDAGDDPPGEAPTIAQSTCRAICCCWR